MYVTYTINNEHLSRDICAGGTGQEYGRSHKVRRSPPASPGNTIETVIHECWILASDGVADGSAEPNTYGQTHMPVATLPGAIAFTLILYPLHSFERPLVKVATAPLAAEYDTTLEPPIYELSDAILMMLPDFRGIKCLPAARQMTNSEFRLTFMTCTSVSSGEVNTGS